MPFDFQVPLGPCGCGRDAPHPDLVESLLHTRFSAAAWAWTHSKKLSIGGFACQECTSDTSNTTERRALHRGEGRFFLHSPSDLLARRWNSPVSTCAAALCSTRHLLYMILVLCIVPGASVLYSPHSITVYNFYAMYDLLHITRYLIDQLCCIILLQFCCIAF